MIAHLIERLDRLANAWIELMAAVAIQALALAALAVAASWILRRCSPAVRHGLWLIVAFKLLIMPLWSLPLTLPEFASSRQPVATGAAQVREGGSISLPIASAPASPATTETGHSARPHSLEPSWSKPLSWPSTLMLIWLGVIAWRIGRIVIERTRLQRCLRRAEILDDPGWNATLDDLARLISLHRVPRVLVTDVAASPFVCGLMRPTLVLPRPLLETLSLPQWRPILLHELAHLKRGDLVWGWLPELARLFLWFHPASHWVARRAQLERELACDGLAMSLSDVDPASYARTLVEVISQAVPA